MRWGILDWMILKTASQTYKKSAPREEKEVFNIWATVVDVYDGDTFTVCYVREGKLRRRRCRCLGYDSPEIKSKNVNEKAAAILAKDFLTEYLPKSPSMFQVNGLDKYGRFLVSYRKNKTELARVMIENGHGYKYDGGKKQTYPLRWYNEELKNKRESDVVPCLMSHRNGLMLS
jgi:endonuclease YncB( thermonuclease family)